MENEVDDEEDRNSLAYKDNLMIIEEKGTNRMFCDTNRSVMIFIALISIIIISVGIILTILANNTSEGKSSYSIIISPPSETMKQACSTESMVSPMGMEQCKA